MPIGVPVGSGQSDTPTGPATWTAPRYECFWRETWSGSPGWALQPYWSVWRIVDYANARPGQAIIGYEYGKVTRAVDAHSAAPDSEPFAYVNGFVRIDELDDEGGRTVVFVGEIFETVDQPNIGRQTFLCVDMRYALSRVFLTEQYATCVTGTDIIGWCPAFNRPMTPTRGASLGNRSTAKKTVTIRSESLSIYIIDNVDQAKWTFRAVLDNVLALVYRQCEFRCDSSPLPTSGADPLGQECPPFEHENHDALTVINAAITATGAAWTLRPVVDYGDPQAPEILGFEIAVFVMHGDDVTIDGVGTITGNTDVFQTPTDAPWFDATWRFSSDRTYDQVLVRGSRIRWTGTLAGLNFPAPGLMTGANLTAGWPEADVTSWLLADPTKWDAARWEDVLSKFVAATAWTPYESGAVSGMESSTGALDPAKVGFMKGARPTIATDFRAGFNYASYNGGPVDTEITATGDRIAAEFLAAESLSPAFYTRRPAIPLSDGVGCRLPGGPAANQDIQFFAHGDAGAVALTLGLETDWRLEARAGATSNRGYTRRLIIDAPNAEFGIVRKAAWAVDQADGTKLYVINGRHAAEWQRLRKQALLRQARMPNSVASVEIAAQIHLPTLHVGQMVRQGALASSTPIMQITRDLRKCETFAVTERSYGA